MPASDALSPSAGRVHLSDFILSFHGVAWVFMKAHFALLSVDSELVLPQLRSHCGLEPGGAVQVAAWQGPGTVAPTPVQEGWDATTRASVSDFNERIDGLG